MAVLVLPLSCWLGLAVAGNAEIAGHGYIRKLALFEAYGNGSAGANVATVQWPYATGNWGTVAIVQIWDSATGGTLLGQLPTITPVPIAQYDRARIPAGGCAITLARVPYGFGTGTFGVGRFNTKSRIDGIPSGIGSPYGAGPYGIGPYATLPLGVLLQLTFEQIAPCAASPGTWTLALTECCG
jgi:hypothetical protein